MTDAPEAIGRQGGQERDASQHFVQRVVVCQAAMAGVMPNNEQAHDRERGEHHTQQLPTNALASNQPLGQTEQCNVGHEQSNSNGG